MKKIVDFYQKCVRVIKITKKPTKQEFLTTVKMAALGILIIGALGFLLQMIFQLF